MVIFIREDFIVKQQLYQNLKKVVNKSFYKKGFIDNFTEEELAEIIELEKFLKEVSLYHAGMFVNDKQKFFCITFRASYTRKNGTVIESFFNKFINQTAFQYDKIEHFIAKCIYRVSKKRCIDTFFAVNTFCLGMTYTENWEPVKLVVRRRRDFLCSSSSLFCDIDLEDDMVALDNEAVLEALKKTYTEVFSEIPPSYIIRSGGGVHLYFALQESFLLTQDDLPIYLDVLRSVQKTFAKSGSDSRCVDAVRILRMPFSFNRKPKYGKNGKRVDVIYQSGSRYSFDEVRSKFSFFEAGGTEGIFRQIVDDMLIDPDRYILESGDLIIENESTPLERMIDTLEDIPSETASEAKETKLPKNESKESHNEIVVAMMKRYKYKGIQQSYDYNTYPAQHYLEKDILFWLQNRDYHEGIRNRIMYFMYYISYVMQWERDEDTLHKKMCLLNKYFKPRMADVEITAFCIYFFQLFSKGHGKRRLRNKTIDNNLFFTNDEKEIAIGNYTDISSYERLHKKELQKKRLNNKRKYEVLYQLFEEIPNITAADFTKMTGYSQRVFFTIRARFVDTVFEANPQLTLSEFQELFSSDEVSSYYKARKRYQKRHNK